jgi:hypothetical protein
VWWLEVAANPQKLVAVLMSAVISMKFVVLMVRVEAADRVHVVQIKPVQMGIYVVIINVVPRISAAMRRTAVHRVRNVVLMVHALYQVWYVAVILFAYSIMNVVRIEAAAILGKHVVMMVRVPNLVSHAVAVILPVHRVRNVVLMVHALQQAGNVVGLVSA